MKKRIHMILAMLIIVVFLIGCKDKSATIAEYHKLETEDFTGMHIMLWDNMKKAKQFTKSQTQDIYDYFSNLEPKESNFKNDENSLESPVYALIFHFNESVYSVSVGENYLLIALNGDYKTIEEAEKNTTLHLISNESINELEEMINKLMDDN